MKAERGENRKRVFGPQDAAGVKRDEHQRPHLETARQRMRDRQSLQHESAAEPPGAGREILGGGTRQRVGERETGKERNAERPGQGKRLRQIGPRPRKIVRQLGRASGGVEIDAQHHERRGGDRRRAKSHQRVSEIARRKFVRRAVEGVGREGGDRRGNLARALSIAPVHDNDGRQHPGAADNSEHRRQCDDGADGGMDRRVRPAAAKIARDRSDRERGQGPGGTGDGSGEQQGRQRFGQKRERGDRDHPRDRSGVKTPTERRDHDRQRREIGERHRENARLRADREQQCGGASRSDRDNKSMQHDERCPASVGG